MIIVRIWEGIGNQMFQYAYARALQAKGMHVRLDMGKAYDEMFRKYRNHLQRTASIQNFNLRIKPIDVHEYGRYSYLNQDTLVRKMLYVLGKNGMWLYNFYEEEEQKYSEKAERIKGNYYIKGWFQSERYFKDIRDVLLKEFTPKKRINISKDVREALNNPQSVSVHIRRGDYVKINNTVNSLYYQKAMHYIGQLYQKPLFLVFSDDLDWVKDNIPIAGEVIYVNEDKKMQDYEELLVMSKCRSNIIANSTFSWWAAWLNQNKEKCVIAPKMWFPGQEGIVPKEWIML